MVYPTSYPTTYVFLPRKECGSAIARLTGEFDEHSISYTQSNYSIRTVLNNVNEYNTLVDVLEDCHEHCPHKDSLMALLDGSLPTVQTFNPHGTKHLFGCHCSQVVVL